MKIPVSEPDLCGNEKKYVMDCLEAGWVSSAGSYVSKFEKKFAEYINSKYATTCSNGTTALHLTLLALDIKNKDEVVLPTLTFVSSANSILYNNAMPVFVDSEIDTWNMDVKKIEDKITDKTKAIMVVHLYGHPVDMDPVLELCKKYDLYLIEDTAEALGSEYKKRKTGSIGDISSFSFYGNKTITTGEGGMITTDDKELIEKINIIKNQGKSPADRYWHDTVGYNYRLTNLQSALGLAQLENIDKFVNKKREIAKYYRDNLEIKGIAHAVEKDYAFNSYWMYSIVLKNNINIKQDEMMKHLERQGVETRGFFHPMHTLPIYSSYYKEKFPIAEKLAKSGINLPSSTKITDDQLDYVCDKIKYIIKKEEWKK